MTHTTASPSTALPMTTLGDKLRYAVLATGVLLAIEVAGAANTVARVTGRIRLPKRWVKIRASAHRQQFRTGS